MLRKIFPILSCLLTAPLIAGTDSAPSTMPADIAAPASYAEDALHEDAVSVLLTSGILPNEPFVNSPRSYTLVPISVETLWTLDDVSNDEVSFAGVKTGWLRGNTSLRFSPFYYDVIHGPESRFVGLLAGPQYNFVQKGWNLVPYVGAQVGLAFCDSGNSGHLPYQQGQDFCFTFGVNAGVRYFLTEKWSLNGEIAYQHFSNAGLSEPAHQNNGLDLLGPRVSLVYNF